MYPSLRRGGPVFVPYVVFCVDDDAPLEGSGVEEEGEEVCEFAAAASAGFEEFYEVAERFGVSEKISIVGSFVLT